MTMLKLTWRSLTAHRLRLLLTALAVTLGVAFVAGTMIFRDTAARSFDSLVQRAGGGAEVTVQAKRSFEGEASARLVPESLLTTLRERASGAATVTGITSGYAAIVGRGGEVVGGTADHAGLAWTPGGGGRQTIVSGQEPTGPGDVAVDSRTATEGGLAVGDQVEIVTEFGSRSMRLVGIFDLNRPGLDNATTFVAFAPATAQELVSGLKPGDERQYSAAWIRPEPGVTQQTLAAEITPLLPAGFEATTSDDTAAALRAQIEEIFTILGQVLLGFAAISVLVGSFIIFNTFTMLVAQRTREMALLRAVGASRRQVTRAVIGEAFAVGLLGSVIGLVVGLAMSYGLNVVAARFGLDIPTRLPVVRPQTIMWSVLVGVVVTVLAAYLPARRAAKIPPVAALRSDTATRTRSMVPRIVVGAFLTLIAALSLFVGATSTGESGVFLAVVGGVTLFLAVTLLSPVLSRPLIKVLGWPAARFGGSAGRLSRENARRDPRRTAATASALTVGLTLVSLATVVTSSLNASMDRRLDREFGADFTMEPKGLTGFPEEAVNRVAGVPGVRSVAPVRTGTLRVGDTEQTVVVADGAALTVPAGLSMVSGQASTGRDEVLVQESLASQRNWRLGSTIAVEYPDQQRADLRVAGIFADNRVLGTGLVIGPVTYQEHGRGDLVQKAFVDLDDAGLDTALAAVRSALSAYPTITLKDRQDAKDAARGDTARILNVIMALLALSIIIAAVGIINTLGLSVIERTKEIGLLRAIGMDRREIRSMIRYESVVIALFGALLGLAMGVGIAVVIQRAMSAGRMEVLAVPAGQLLVLLLGAVLLGVLASIWPAARAARMGVLAAIRHE